MDLRAEVEACIATKQESNDKISALVEKRAQLVENLRNQLQQTVPLYHHLVALYNSLKLYRFFRGMRKSKVDSIILYKKFP